MMRKMRIKLDNGAYMPMRAHAQDAGYDLRTPVDVAVPAHGFAVVDTGVHIELPKGKCAVIVSKSGLFLRLGITSMGLIDEGFIGTLKVGLVNHTGRPYAFRRGEKISQFYVTDYYAYDLEVVEEISGGERGSRGYGSTGR